MSRSRPSAANHIWHDGRAIVGIQTGDCGYSDLSFTPLVGSAYFLQRPPAVREAKSAAGLRQCASVYVRDFREKWIKDQNPEGERLLGTGDIQSLADLGNSFTVVNETRLVPFDKALVFYLAIILAAPLLPLLLFVFPLEEMIDRIVALLL